MFFCFCFFQLSLHCYLELKIYSFISDSLWIADLISFPLISILKAIFSMSLVTFRKEYSCILYLYQGKKPQPNFAECIIVIKLGNNIASFLISLYLNDLSQWLCVLMDINTVYSLQWVLRNLKLQVQKFNWFFVNFSTLIYIT